MRTETTRSAVSRSGVERQGLPLSALLALVTAVFITGLTGTLPAGLLPAMSADLGVGESAAGQTGGDGVPRRPGPDGDPADGRDRRVAAQAHAAHRDGRRYHRGCGGSRLPPQG